MLPVRPPVACSCRGICVSTPSSAAVSVYQTVFDDAYPLRQFSVGSVELSPAPVVSIVLVNGKLVIGVAAEHRSFAGNVPLTELMMISTFHDDIDVGDGCTGLDSDWGGHRRIIGRIAGGFVGTIPKLRYRYGRGRVERSDAGATGEGQVDGFNLDRIIGSRLGGRPTHNIPASSVVVARRPPRDRTEIRM